MHLNATSAQRDSRHRHTLGKNWFITISHRTPSYRRRNWNQNKIRLYSWLLTTAADWKLTPNIVSNHYYIYLASPFLFALICRKQEVHLKQKADWYPVFLRSFFWAVNIANSVSTPGRWHTGQIWLLSYLLVSARLTQLALNILYNKWHYPQLWKLPGTPPNWIPSGQTGLSLSQKLFSIFAQPCSPAPISLLASASS